MVDVLETLTGLSITKDGVSISISFDEADNLLDDLYLYIVARETRMDVVARNGNDGLHYDTEPEAS